MREGAGEGERGAQGAAGGREGGKGQAAGREKGGWQFGNLSFQLVLDNKW